MSKHESPGINSKLIVVKILEPNQKVLRPESFDAIYSRRILDICSNYLGKKDTRNSAAKDINKQVNSSISQVVIRIAENAVVARSVLDKRILLDRLAKTSRRR